MLEEADEITISHPEYDSLMMFLKEKEIEIETLMTELHEVFAGVEPIAGDVSRLIEDYYSEEPSANPFRDIKLVCFSPPPTHAEGKYIPAPVKKHGK